MAFCRRCGDIVSGPRCNKCGGAPVAPVIQWHRQSAQGANKDRWSQTYVANSSAPQPASQNRVVSKRSLPSLSHGATALTSRVSEHIASATNPSPSPTIKHSSVNEDALLSAPDVISSPYSSELSKVYGSVLQPKETLESFHCHTCSSPFTPDATIYPDPAHASGERYMCRSCFSQNGGSRGNCVGCSRPVLILKSEGGFVENAGRFWHKKCFNCSGCGKSIGNNPVVDLLGHPSCAECFDTCLDRRDTPRKSRTSASAESVDNLVGLKPVSATGPGKARKGSSTIEELEQVLGIPRRQSASDVTAAQVSSPSNVASMSLASASQSYPPSSLPRPVPNDTRPASAPSKDIASFSPQSSTPPKPTAGAIRGPTKVTPEGFEAAKKRFLKQTRSPPGKCTEVTPTRGRCRDTLETPTKSPMRYSDFRLLRRKDSTSSIGTDRDSMLSLSSAASIPSLISDHSEMATISSGLSSPPPSLSSEHEDLISLLSSSPSSSLSGRPIKSVFSNTRSSDLSSETLRVSTKPSSSSKTREHSPLPDTTCAKCALPLFDVAHGGKYVSVPEPSSTGSLPKTYHADCFRCRICNGLFEEKEAGRAVFVRGVRGACHLNCAPMERAISRKPVPVTPPLSTHRLSGTPTHASREQSPSTASPSASTAPLSSRYSAPLQFAASVSNPMPRFGTSTPCPGCSQSVSPMERGVVPGPQGQRWHSSCLVCGGKQAKGRGGRRVNGQPGCGKQLDSSAKRDCGAGGVWCRDCLLLLPNELRSPTRSSHSKPAEADPAASSGGQPDRIFPQHAGVTTIARQFTGLSERHVTGGRLSPTKQLGLGLGSPTKVAVQFTGGGSKGTIRPRPKSAIGMRGEGRGMFLVQQLTGGGGL
ncbi:hypothetical protein F5148DRAFT_1192754 [Russula earlei]|uniref:Uncharacterized protein n=1 Tax=Russula earlei TaxID=71964 RepID=A0ACC0UC30_9AGAM|nr:hypothetical protein F5148DRAFT_1192754 [Russula earlei]